MLAHRIACGRCEKQKQIWFHKLNSIDVYLTSSFCPSVGRRRILHTNCLFFAIPHFTENILFIAFRKLLWVNEIFCLFLVPLREGPSWAVTIERLQFILHTFSSVFKWCFTMLPCCCCVLRDGKYKTRKKALENEWKNPRKGKNKYPTRMPSTMLSIWHELFNVCLRCGLWEIGSEYFKGFFTAALFAICGYFNLLLCSTKFG